MALRREDLSYKGSGFAFSASEVKIMKISSDALNQARAEVAIIDLQVVLVCSLNQLNKVNSYHPFMKFSYQQAVLLTII